MSEGARSTLVELIVEAVRSSMETLTPEAEGRLRQNLAGGLSPPFIDGQVITATYLNLLETRLRVLEHQVIELRAKVASGRRSDEARPEHGKTIRTGGQD